MAEEFVEVKKKVKDKETGEEKVVVTKYRVDADFKPTKASQIVMQYIENWCVANGKIDWLVDTVSKTYTDKNGKEGKIQFVKLRAMFVDAFMPEIKEQPKTVTKKKTFVDKILEKYGNKAE